MYSIVTRRHWVIIIIKGKRLRSEWGSFPITVIFVSASKDHNTNYPPPTNSILVCPDQNSHTVPPSLGYRGRAKSRQTINTLSNKYQFQVVFIFILTMDSWSRPFASLFHSTPDPPSIVSPNRLWPIIGSVAGGRHEEENLKKNRSCVPPHWHLNNVHIFRYGNLIKNEFVIDPCVDRSLAGGYFRSTPLTVVVRIYRKTQKVMASAKQMKFVGVAPPNSANTMRGLTDKHSTLLECQEIHWIVQNV